MVRPRLVIKPTPLATRLLLVYGRDELLKAALPPYPYVDPLAAPTLCEALSVWLQSPLSVVLFADARDSSSELGLSDGLGFGLSTPNFEVDVVDTVRRRPLGSFRDLRRLDPGVVR